MSVSKKTTKKTEEKKYSTEKLLKSRRLAAAGFRQGDPEGTGIHDL